MRSPTLLASFTFSLAALALCLLGGDREGGGTSTAEPPRDAREATVEACAMVAAPQGPAPRPAEPERRRRVTAEGWTPVPAVPPIEGRPLRLELRVLGPGGAPFAGERLRAQLAWSDGGVERTLGLSTGATGLTPAAGSSQRGWDGREEVSTEFRTDLEGRLTVWLPATAPAAAERAVLRLKAHAEYGGEFAWHLAELDLPRVLTPEALGSAAVDLGVRTLGPPPCVTAGRVSAQSGQPLEGVGLFLPPEAPTLTGIGWTDAEGRFRFEGFTPLGALQVGVQADRYDRPPSCALAPTPRVDPCTPWLPLTLGRSGQRLVLPDTARLDFLCDAPFEGPRQWIEVRLSAREPSSSTPRRPPRWLDHEAALRFQAPHDGGGAVRPAAGRGFTLDVQSGVRAVLCVAAAAEDRVDVWLWDGLELAPGERRDLGRLAPPSNVSTVVERADGQPLRRLAFFDAEGVELADVRLSEPVTQIPVRLAPGIAAVGSGPFARDLAEVRTGRLVLAR